MSVVSSQAQMDFQASPNGTDQLGQKLPLFRIPFLQS